MSSVIEKIRSAKQATMLLRLLNDQEKKDLLQSIHVHIENNASKITEVNTRDVERSKKEQLAPALLKRLECGEKKVKEILTMIEAVSKQKDLLYQTITKRELASGLVLTKRYVPLGTIGMIFESRPDALVQMAILCLKTSNAVVLKGGSEARETNAFLHRLIVEATHDKIQGWIQLLEDRSEVDGMIKSKGKDSVDIIIPRGSDTFVSYIMEHASVPVLGHADGICHMYVHEDANIQVAAEVLLDAKLQYAAVCNAVECLLVHEDRVSDIIQILNPSIAQGLELYVDESISNILSKADISHHVADESAWGREYNDAVLSVRAVHSLDEAVAHINHYGSGHTDIIMSTDEECAKTFQNMVDSSSVMWNCSSRFADGYRYGLGAEVGISTSKIHARGPVGAEGLLSTQWLLEGQGHVVAPFANGEKNFTHRDIGK